MITSASPFRQSAKRLFPVLLLPGFALALILAMWTALTSRTIVEGDAAHHEAVIHSQAQARILSEHVSHMLRQSDHATQLFKLSYEHRNGNLRLTEFARRDGLLDSVLPARLKLPMVLVDRDGRVVDSANTYAAELEAERASVRAFAASGSGESLFSTPLLDPKTKKWQIQVARRLDDSRGDYNGAIIIMIDPLYFVDDYDRLNIDDDGALFLLAPGSGLAIGRAGERLTFSDSLRFRPVRGKRADSDEMAPNVALDHIPRIYSYSDMQRYPMVAVVGVTERAAMERFETHRRRYVVIALVASASILLVVALLMRQSARLRASMRTASEAQATLRAAADASLDGVIILKAWRDQERQIRDFIITDINDKGAAMLGRRRAELMGQRAFALLPRFASTGFFDRYVEVFTQGRPLEEEVRLRGEGERARWIHHQIVPIPDGVAVTSRDISARKRAEIEVLGKRSFLQSLIDHLPLLIYVKSARPASLGTLVVWNKAAETVTGYAADDVVGRVDAAFPSDFGLFSAGEDEAMATNPITVDLPERPLRRPDGTLRYLHSVSVPLFDAAGQLEYILCIAEDVTQRRAQEHELRNSEAQLTAVTNASPLGLIRTDIHGNCTYVNRMFETITGMAREQALGLGWLEVVACDEGDFKAELFAQQRTSQEPFQRIVRCRHPDGRLIWTSLKAAAVRIDGRIEGFVGTIDDITTLREAEIALRESESRLRTIADTLPAMVAYLDANQTYRFQNLAYEREFGRIDNAGHGTTVRATVGEKRYALLAPYIARALAGETVRFEEHNEGGPERTLEVSYIPQRGEDGRQVVGFHVMRQDITSQKREKRRLLKLAQVDALTGLANRAGFLQKLDIAMQESDDDGRLMALIYMDIDHFKPVNDTHGHNVGDALLKAFSTRLTQTLRMSDTVARLGGDEFTIIMEKLSRPEDATALAAKIVAAMQAPFALDGITVSVSASIGLAYYRGGPVEPDELLHQADMLLYQAKQEGRNTFRAAS